jgi:RecG-like helicase
VDQVPAGQPLPDAVATPADAPYERPPPRRGVTPIGSLTRPGRATVEGRVHTVEIRPVEHNTVLACDVEDATGQLTAMFYGRSNIAGLRPGVKVRLRGQVGIRNGRPVMINPAYELLAPGEATSAEQQEERDQQDSQPKRGRNRRDDQQG